MKIKDLTNFVPTEKDLFIIDSLFSMQELVHANLLAIPEEALPLSKNIFDEGGGIRLSLTELGQKFI